MIPKRLVRTVPADTSAEQERLWLIACELHPDWEHVTLRDPIDAKRFPITSSYWGSCETGAQLADLVRAEELFWRGGVYIDSDYECFASFDVLLPLAGFAAYEDADHIPNAVMGFHADHAALQQVLQLAIQRHDKGTWESGVGVTTQVFKDRHDMLILPPGCFYPVHYKTKQRTTDAGLRAAQPWAFGVHHWAHSWA